MRRGVTRCDAGPMIFRAAWRCSSYFFYSPFHSTSLEMERKHETKCSRIESGQENRIFHGITIKKMVMIMTQTTRHSSVLSRVLRPRCMTAPRPLNLVCD